MRVDRVSSVKDAGHIVVLEETAMVERESSIAKAAPIVIAGR